MLLVVPVSLSDRKNIPLIEKAFEIFPPGSGHKLLVVGSPQVEDEVKDLSQKLCIHFAGNAQTFLFDTDSNLGWPTACNYYAQQTAFYIPGSFPLDTLWLWFELDCTPLKANWLDEIEAFCLREQMTALREERSKPFFFGVKEKVYLERAGALMPSDEAGSQMAACGVYPADLPERALTLRNVTSTNHPWNTWIRWYVLESLMPMELIQNNWRTTNYERQPDGKITCKSIANWAWDKHFNDPVRPGAVLLHGCKDGSLIELFQAERETLKGEAPVEAYWTDPAPEPVPTESAGMPADAYTGLPPAATPGKPLVEVFAEEKKTAEKKPSPARKPPAEISPYKRRQISNEQVKAARERLLKMHEERRAALLQRES